MQIVDKIISNFVNNKSLYIGEKVTMSEHMIQTAMLAEKAKCDDNLICSCLLHDYGHFILEKPEELVKLNVDGHHENIGYEYLKIFFEAYWVNNIDLTKHDNINLLLDKLKIFCASITSKILFIKVAESIEIFFPIFHLGCLRA